MPTMMKAFVAVLNASLPPPMAIMPNSVTSSPSQKNSIRTRLSASTAPLTIARVMRRYAVELVRMLAVPHEGAAVERHEEREPGRRQQDEGAEVVEAQEEFHAEAGPGQREGLVVIEQNDGQDEREGRRGQDATPHFAVAFDQQRRRSAGDQAG